MTRIWVLRLTVFQRFALCFTIVALLAACWGTAAKIRSHRRANAVAYFKSYGAVMRYGYQQRALEYRMAQGIDPFDAERVYAEAMKSEPDGPPWLRSMFGKDAFNSIEVLYVPTDRIIMGDELDDLAGHLQFMRDLRSLSIDPAELDSDVMEAVGQLTELWKLDLSHVKFKEGDLACLSSLKKLAELDLSFTNAQDADIAFLKGHADLTHVDIEGTGVSDSGIRSLQRFAPKAYVLFIADSDKSAWRRLQEIDQFSLHAGDDGRIQTVLTSHGGFKPKHIEIIKTLDAVQDLMVSSDTLKDSDMEAFCAAVKQVESLELSCPRLTSASAKPLSTLTNLKELTILGGDFSPIAILELELALTNAEVTYDRDAGEFNDDDDDDNDE